MKYAVWLGLLFATVAHCAEPTEFPENIKGKVPPSAIVRIFALDEKTSGRSSGTGTLISPVYIVTASHVVGPKGATVEVLFYPTWDVVTGKVIESSKTEGENGYDVALIELDKPRSEKPIPLGAKAALGGVHIQGFSHGPYTLQSGTYFTVDTTSRWGLIRGSQARNGDSGGPVIQGGKLVGVLWGSIPNQTWFTPIENMYKVLPQIAPVEIEKVKEDEKKDTPRQYTL